VTRGWLIGATTFVIVVCQHLVVAVVGGYPVTVALVVGTIALPFVFPRPNWLVLLGGEAVLLVLATLAAMTNLTHFSAELFGTLGLFVYAVAVLSQSIAVGAPALVGSSGFQNGLFAALAAVVGVSALQVVTGTLGGQWFFNLFGDLQYGYQYNPRLDINPIPRAQGFFLEPSYDAFVIGTLAVALLCLRKLPLWTTLLAIVGMFVTQSATGLGILLVVAVALALTSRPRIALAAGATLLAGAVVMGPYLWGRAISITNSESSAYYRIVAPLRTLVDVLQSHPFGYPLGSVYEVLKTYRLTMAGIPQYSLDNGAYLLVFYFGWPGVLLLAALLAVSIRTLIVRRRQGGLSWIAPIWLIGSLFFSGAIMAPEFALMTGIVLVCIAHSGRAGDASPAGAGTQRRDRHLPRSARLGQDAPVAG
jgi:putative colanic acid polymerase